MSHLLFSIGALAATVMLAASPAPPGQKVQLPKDWPEGSVYRAEVTREKSTTRAGKTSTSRTRTPLTIDVIERTDAGFKLGWTMGRTEVLEPAGKLDPAQERLVNLAEGMKLIIQTDEDASPDKLVNAGEVTKFYQKVLVEVQEFLKQAGRTPEEIKQAMAMVEPLTRLENIQTIAFKEPNIFFLAVGGEYVPGKTVEYEDQLPNPLTGKIIPAKASVGLKSVNREQNEAVIHWQQTPDPEALEAKATVEDTATCLINLKTGWPNRVEYQRRIVVGDVERVEKIHFSVRKE